MTKIEEYTNKIIQGDCLDGMKQLPDNSIEAVITDIPYALTSIQKRFGKKGSAKAKFGNDGSFQRLSGGFMGKEWDSDLPSVEIFKEIYRVLRKGAFFVTTFTPRQSNQLALYQRLVEAGFDIEFSPIYWVQNQGFPKASNYGKMADKTLFMEWLKSNDDLYQEYKDRKEQAQDNKKLKKEFDDWLKQLKKDNGFSREVICIDKNSRPNSNRGNLLCHGVYGKEWNTITPSTPQAKSLEGWYSYSPKPSVEPIIIAKKPSGEKTLIDCALKSLEDDTYAVGGVNFDECRIPIQGTDDRSAGHRTKTFGSDNVTISGGEGSPDYVPDNQGRFPSNLVCQDDALNDGIERKSGWADTDKLKIIPQKDNNVYNGGALKGETGKHFGDSGTNSRYYDIDAWFEKNVGRLPTEAQMTYPCLQVSKPSKREKNNGLEEFKYKRNCRWNNGGEWQDLETQNYGNNHPTTKPIKLFSYLLKLFSRPDKVILDPFAGSGTTLCACSLIKQSYIGFELDKDYCKIADARIKYWNMTELERDSYDRIQDKIERVNQDTAQNKLFEVNENESE